MLREKHCPTCLFILSFFQLPKRVRTRLEKIQWKFLCRGANMDRKIHLIRWETVCSNKKRGGLGITNLSLVSRDLLG